MTSEQKYGEVLKELGALLADKNCTISNQRWQIDQLKEKLAKAEQERDDAAQARDELQEIAAMQQQRLLDATCEIERLKGGAA